MDKPTHSDLANANKIWLLSLYQNHLRVISISSDGCKKQEYVKNTVIQLLYKKINRRDMISVYSRISNTTLKTKVPQKKTAVNDLLQHSKTILELWNDVSQVECSASDVSIISILWHFNSKTLQINPCHYNTSRQVHCSCILHKCTEMYNWHQYALSTHPGIMCNILNIMHTNFADYEQIMFSFYIDICLPYYFKHTHIILTAFFR